MPAWPVVFRVHSLRRIGGPVAALCVAATVATIASANLDSPSLWIAHSQGVSRLNPEDATTLADRAVATGARAVAVDRERDRVWVLTEKELEFSNLAGLRLGTIRLEGSQGHPAALRLDPRSGVLWVGLHSRVHAIDGSAARVVAQHRLPAALSAIALDIDNGLLWVAASDTLYALNAEAAVVQSVRLAGVKRIAALDYAPALRQLWVVADDSLRLLAADGEASLVLRSPWLAGVHRVASDGASGLWAADRSTLAHLDRSGAVRLSLAPFAGFPSEKITDLAADAADGSVWVASTRRVIHLSADGAVLAQGEPQGADPAARLIAGLFLEGGAPRLEFVAPANGSFLAQARPTFTLRFSGSAVDPDSLRFMRDASAVAMDCDVEEGFASCTPLAAFADGAYILDATIANTRGQRSTPTRLQFTIDTVTPMIEIVAPPTGLLTNQTQLTVSGRLSESASLTLNGQAVAIGTDRSFSASGVTLKEGVNLLQLIALDRAGNRGQAARSVVLDSIAPPPAVSGALSVQLLPGGQVRVSGAAGSVEGGVLVMIVNARTGTTVATAAAADGSFSAVLAAQLDDELRVTATDAAGNRSEVTVVAVATSGPFSGAIQIAASSPADGSTVVGDFVLVSVDLQAPPNTGVTVNDFVAVPTPLASGQRFYAVVPLETGANTLTIKAHGQDGRVMTRTTRVTSSGPFAYRISPTAAAGVGPIEVEFRVADPFSRGIVQISADFDNDGITDLISDGTVPVKTTYTGTGLRHARIVVFDGSGRGFSQVLTLVLIAPETMDRGIQAVWGAMNASLAAGDREGALQYLSAPAREQYGPVFDLLLPRMPQIVASYSQLQRSLVGGSYSEYGVNRLIDGVDRIFLVAFVQNELGQWQIDSM